MKFYQKLDGSVHVSAREYDVASDTAIAEGQVVKLCEGLVVGVDKCESGAILGIAAENHSGISDALDPRADGKKIFVIDDPSIVMQCRAPLVAATGGSGTTLRVLWLNIFSSRDFNGGYVKLICKSEDSTNTDVIGQVRRIMGFTPFYPGDAAGVLTLEEGGTPAAGDIYALFPPIGFSKGSLEGDSTALTLNAAANLPVKVMGHDCGLGKIYLIAKRHIFAASSA